MSLRKPPENCPNGEACTLPDRREWHLEKSVSVGHLVTTLAALCAFGWWAARQEARLSLVEDRVMALAETDKRMEQERNQLKTELREDLREINRKLDELVNGRRR